MIKSTKINRFFYPYCIYLCISAFIMTRGVFLLYLASVGLDMFQIAIYQSIYSISTALLEIPTGFVGDKLGQKKSLMIGTLLLAMHAVFMYCNSIVVIFWILGFLEALAYSFISGSDSALLYDILKKSNLQEKYLKINNIIMSIRSVATGLALIIGAFLAKFSWGYVYLITAGVFTTAFLMLFFVPDIRAMEEKKEKSVKGFLHTVKQQILYPLPIVFMLFILVSSACDGLFMCYYNFNQIILSQYHLSIEWIGFFFSALYFINSAAYLLVNLMVKKMNRKQIFVLFLFLESGLFFVLSLCSNIIVVVIISAMICFCPEILYSVSDSIIQQYIKSDYRATLLSIVSFIHSLTSSIIYMVLGYISASIKWEIILCYFSLIICVVTIISALAMLVLRKVERVR